MLKHLYPNALALLLSVSFASGQWVNFPLSNSYTNDDGYVIATNCHPIMQVWSAVVERANIINNGSNYVNDPSFTTTYLVSAGTNYTVVTNGSYVYSNYYRVETNVTVTNCLTPFTYNYTDLSGAHTATGYPYVTAALLADIDTTIADMLPYYFGTNYGIGATLGTYFNGKTDVSDILPMESLAGSLYRNGIPVSGHWITFICSRNQPGYGINLKIPQGIFFMVLPT